MTTCVLVGSGQAKPKSPSFVIRVSSVEPSPGFWPGVVLSYQYLNGIVVHSSAIRFPIGTKLRIGVPPNGNSPLFERDTPQLNETMVSAGKLLRVSATKECVGTSDENEFITDSSCLRSFQK
jgi:hypothetical protein